MSLLTAYPTELKLGMARRALKLSIAAFCLLLPLSIAGANIGWGLILLSLLLYAAFGGKIPYGCAVGHLAKPLAIYVAVAILTSALGIDPGHSARYLHQDIHKLWFYLLFSIALSVEHKSRGIELLTLGFISASFIGIGQSLASLILAKDWERAHAFVHPVTYGEQMCLALLGATCLLLKPGAGDNERPPRGWLYALLLSASAALILSNTRGALLAFSGGVLAIGSVLPKWRKRFYWALPLTAVLSIALVLTIESRRYGQSSLSAIRHWTATGQLDSSGQLTRLTLWKVAWRMGLDHPWTGVGLNNYRSAFHLYFSGIVEDGARDFGTAHNLYLHHFAERGLAGLAALALFLGTLWKRSLQRARENPDAWNLWAHGATAAFLIMNLTEVALQTEIVWMLMIFIWTWAEVRHRSKSNPEESAGTSEKC